MPRSFIDVQLDPELLRRLAALQQANRDDQRQKERDKKLKGKLDKEETEQDDGIEEDRRKKRKPLDQYGAWRRGSEWDFTWIHHEPGNPSDPYNDLSIRVYSGDGKQSILLSETELFGSKGSPPSTAAVYLSEPTYIPAGLTCYLPTGTGSALFIHHGYGFWAQEDPVWIARWLQWQDWLKNNPRFEDGYHPPDKPLRYRGWTPFHLLAPAYAGVRWELTGGVSPLDPKYLEWRTTGMPNGNQMTTYELPGNTPPGLDIDLDDDAMWGGPGTVYVQPAGTFTHVLLVTGTSVQRLVAPGGLVSALDSYMPVRAGYPVTDDLYTFLNFKDVSNWYFTAATAYDPEGADFVSFDSSVIQTPAPFPALVGGRSSMPASVTNWLSSTQWYLIPRPEVRALLPSELQTAKAVHIYQIKPDPPDAVRAYYGYQWQGDLQTFDGLLGDSLPDPEQWTRNKSSGDAGMAEYGLRSSYAVTDLGAPGYCQEMLSRLGFNVSDLQV